MQGVAWLEVQFGTESLVKVVQGEWVENELWLGHWSLLEVVIGAMAESLSKVVFGPLFGTLALAAFFVEPLAALLVEVGVGAWFGFLTEVVFPSLVGSWVDVSLT